MAAAEMNEAQGSGKEPAKWWRCGSSRRLFLSILGSLPTAPAYRKPGIRSLWLLDFFPNSPTFLAPIVMSLGEHFAVSHAPSLINHWSKCCFSHVLYDLVAQNRSAASAQLWGAD